LARELMRNGLALSRFPGYRATVPVATPARKCIALASGRSFCSPSSLPPPLPSCRRPFPGGFGSVRSAAVQCVMFRRDALACIRDARARARAQGTIRG
jgi:hypothetical protein